MDNGKQDHAFMITVECLAIEKYVHLRCEKCFSILNRTEQSKFDVIAATGSQNKASNSALALKYSSTDVLRLRDLNNEWIW